jgi:hypothetical protein
MLFTKKFQIFRITPRIAIEKLYYSRPAAHWDLLEILVRKFKRGNQLVL